MKFSVFQVSRKGGREKNEDRMGYSYTREAGLFVLADGMGGHPEGEVAAQITLQTMSSQFQRDARPRVPDPSAFLASGIMAAHHQIIRYASERAMLDTPRTTVVAAVIQAEELHWAHCGDSRLYVMREGELITRTRDHSYMEAQVRSGATTEGINRNVLFTCLGSTVRPMFEVADPLRLREGDRVMLCSDGLWGSIDDAQIVRTLSSLPVGDAVPSLVEMALRKAGARSDNVTVLALEWETPSESAPTGFTETEAMHDAGFESTIQSDDIDALVDEMDDDAIERSIAEINQAIQRTATRRG
ncbi:MAG: protein phosphatase 2C domain-containing protein [Proteobacteria bacterium]|jgi:serine/threonine protein phosphatase PrpC|nr:protein phosphatase 2C domain-containing protein [Pseudomonadota bacterium]